MGVTPVDLYKIVTETGRRYICPETNDINECLESEEYLIDDITIGGSGIFGKIHHPESPVIIFPAKQFIQLYWREVDCDEIHRAILGGSAEASCFGGLHIEPLTVYAIRNIMANDIEIRRYRPWIPQTKTLETVPSDINTSH